MLRKIITGGQSGVDRAAGDAAAKLGVSHSHGFSKDPAPGTGSEAGRANLHSLSAFSKSPSIEKDVLAADGTLVITPGSLSRELETIRELVQRHRRPWLHVNFQKTPAFQASTLIGDWITQHQVEILYVTGSDSNVNQKIYEKTYHVLTSAYWLLQRHTDPVGGSPHLFGSPENQRPPEPKLPQDVAEAVERLTVAMSLKDRTTLSNMTENELYTLNYTLGSYIRNTFGIWTGNAALMASCRRIAKNPHLHEKDASSIIIRELWKTLKKTHKLRVIK